eukprot:g8852.t1
MSSNTFCLGTMEFIHSWRKQTISAQFSCEFWMQSCGCKDGRRWTIDFWDTAGQEQFLKLHASYYFQANACILAFDVTRKITYKNLETWYKEIRHYCPDIPVVCVANKIDLPFFFVSCADGTNVVRVFKEAISLAIKNKEHPPDEVLAEIYALLAEDDRHPTKAETEATEETTYDEGPAEDASPPPPAPPVA